MNIAICEIVLAVLLHSYIVFQCVKFKDELQQNMPIYLRWFWVVGIACTLATYYHPGKKGDYFFCQ